MVVTSNKAELKLKIERIAVNLKPAVLVERDEVSGVYLGHLSVSVSGFWHGFCKVRSCASSAEILR